MLVHNFLRENDKFISFIFRDYVPILSLKKFLIDLFGINLIFF